MDRRLFLRNASAFGALAGLSAMTPAWARSALTLGPNRVEGLAPTVRRPGLVEYDLTIDRTRLAFGGRTGTAVTMNGSVPGPLLRFTEGDEAVIRVHNKLDEMTSVHWHGLILPNDQDGVPHVNFPGIAARSTFEYRYPIRQFGTYWCHSHSAFQEQQGHYAALVIDPAGPEPHAYDREYVVVLSDWTFEDPHDVLANLKKRANYYNYQRQTLAGLVAGEGMGAGARLDWDRMQALDAKAPAHFTSPLGRDIPIDYSGEHPEISLRLQEMFGQRNHPTVGRRPLRVTLLSPARRPVQTTMDLPGFWDGSYADVRKDMKAQYPRHPWPEDPRQADPTLRAKPRGS